MARNMLTVDVAIGVALLLNLPYFIVNGEGLTSPQGLTSPTEETSPLHFISPSDLLDHLLKKTRYDAGLRPFFFEQKPVNITINLYVTSLSSIDEMTMDFTMSFFLRQYWTDPRLCFSSNFTFLNIPPNIMKKIWIPDLIFRNEKRADFHEVTVPNRFMRIYPNGTIQYSVRITAALSCPMDLHKFPHDVQNCSAIIESYGSSKTQVRIEWKENQPVKGLRNLTTAQFILDPNPLTGICTINYAETGDFPCLDVIFHLKREFGYYLWHTYVPSVLTVVLSWVSFWINRHAIPERISLGVTTVLTMTTQVQGQDAPRVSYVKSIDVWMFACTCFVFAALVEFAIVNSVGRKKAYIQKKEYEQGLNTSIILKCKADESEELGSSRSPETTIRMRLLDNPDDSSNTMNILEMMAQRTVNNSRKPDGCVLRKEHCMSSQVHCTKCQAWCRLCYFGFVSGERIDRVSRVFFPLAFLGFIVVYRILFT